MLHPFFYFRDYTVFDYTDFVFLITPIYFRITLII